MAGILQRGWPDPQRPLRPARRPTALIRRHNVSQSFSLARSRCDTISDPALRDEIQLRTGNVDATSRILRSIDRFGADPSIRSYEIAPRPQYRQARTQGAIAWTVRAVR